MLVKVHVTRHVNRCCGRHYIIVTARLDSRSVMWTQYAGFKQSYNFAPRYVTVDEQMIGSDVIGDGVMNREETGERERECTKRLWQGENTKEGRDEHSEGKVNSPLVWQLSARTTPTGFSLCTPSLPLSCFCLLWLSRGHCVFTPKPVVSQLRAQVRGVTCDASAGWFAFVHVF